MGSISDLYKPVDTGASILGLSKALSAIGSAYEPLGAGANMFVGDGALTSIGRLGLPAGRGADLAGVFQEDGPLLVETPGYGAPRADQADLENRDLEVRLPELVQGLLASSQGGDEEHAPGSELTAAALRAGSWLTDSGVWIWEHPVGRVLRLVRSKPSLTTKQRADLQTKAVKTATGIAATIITTIAASATPTPVTITVAVYTAMNAAVALRELDDLVKEVLGQPSRGD